jgi:hypothetical protein
MKLRSLLSWSVLVCLFAAPNARATQLTFTLYAVGLPVAESNMSFDLAPATYAMGLRYRITGVAKIFTGDHLDQTVKGTFERDRPVPLEFRSNITLHSQDRIVVLQYRNGNPTATTTIPSNESERDIVPPADREHTLDPLSALVDMLRVTAQTGRCDLSRTTYDGRRLEMFQARTVGEEVIPSSGRSVFSGRALRCDYSSKPLTGFRVGDQREEDSRARNGTFWLAQVAPGAPRLPVQAVVDIRLLGSATMYLTAVTP